MLSSLTKIITGSPSKQPAGPNAHPRCCAPLAYVPSSKTSVKRTDLETGVEYRVFVQALSGDGYGAESETTEGDTAKGAAVLPRKQTKMSGVRWAAQSRWGGDKRRAPRASNDKIDLTGATRDESLPRHRRGRRHRLGARAAPRRQGRPRRHLWARGAVDLRNGRRLRSPLRRRQDHAARPAAHLRQARPPGPQTTEHYLGLAQNLHDAPCDRLGLVGWEA